MKPNCRIGKVKPKNPKIAYIGTQKDGIKAGLQESYNWAMETEMPWNSYALVLWDDKNFDAVYICKDRDILAVPEMIRQRIYERIDG